MTRMDDSRRRYLKATAAAGTVGLAGLSGCIGDLSVGGGGDGGDGSPIHMGSLLPITGELSDYGEGMQEAVNLAVDHVNDADGPLGRRIEIHNEDSETKADKANQKYDSLVNEDDIVGFVGAASSGVTIPLAEQVADDGVMQVSNASTSPPLAEMGYDGDTKYFARTAPNDAQQGIVMSRILDSDEYVGADTVAFLYVENEYGQGLVEKAEAAIESEVVASIGYDPRSSDYTSTLEKVFADDPDAVGFAGYPGNGRTILEQWDNGGYGGEWVLSEGLNSADFFEELSDITDGMYLASPDPEQTDGGSTFDDEMSAENTLFAAHAYDGLFLMALAIHRAGETSGEAIARNIQSVSSPEGTTVTVGEFEEAKELLDDGEDVNYQGASSPVDLNDSLEPLNRFAIMRVSGGATESLETIPREEFEGEL